jgi:hypothetical protein
MASLAAVVPPVAVAGVVLARNELRRAVWTAPIKALVAEKFFDLVELLGAVNVGLATGDAAINVDAPVLVCTAEVLANHALGPVRPVTSGSPASTSSTTTATSTGVGRGRFRYSSRPVWARATSCLATGSARS